MKFRRLCADFYVAGELQPDDIGRLRARGINSLVNNLSTTETGRREERIRVAAEAAGLVYAHVPVGAGSIGDDDLAAFARATADLPKPVCAFCFTGERSMTCWALSQLGRQSTYAIVEAIEGADFISDVVRRQMGRRLNGWTEQAAYG